MRLSRTLVPLILALLLLCAQQGGAMHVLRHVLSEQNQQHDKHAPHSSTCGYCSVYTQLGGVLGSSHHFLAVIAIPSGAIRFITIAQRFSHPLVAIARGPPIFLQKIA